MEYIACFTISTILLIFSNKVNEKWKGLFVFISLMIPCILAGLRSNTVGTDYNVYLLRLYEKASVSNSFWEYQNSSWYLIWRNIYVHDIEIGFTILIYILTKVFHSVQVCAFCVEVLVVVPTYFAIKKTSRKYCWIGFLAFLFLFYNISLNLMRQSIAMSLMLLAFSSIIERNKLTKSSLFLFLLSILFHTSALIFVPIYLTYVFIIRKNKIGNNLKFVKKSKKYIITTDELKMYLLVIVAIICVYAVLKIDALRGALSDYSYYISGSFTFSFRQLLIRVPVLIMYYYCFLSNRYEMKYFFFLMLLFDLVISQMASLSPQTIRFSYYFSMFEILGFSFFFQSNNMRNYKIFSLFMILYFFIYWIYKFVYLGHGETFPYRLM